MVRTATFTLAALASCIAGPLFVGSPALAGESSTMSAMPMSYCAGGYHSDMAGNCQPNGGEVDNRCPPGAIPMPWPNGQSYRCVDRNGVSTY